MCIQLRRFVRTFVSTLCLSEGGLSSHEMASSQFLKVYQTHWHIKVMKIILVWLPVHCYKYPLLVLLSINFGGLNHILFFPHVAFKFWLHTHNLRPQFYACFTGNKPDWRSNPILRGVAKPHWWEGWSDQALAEVRECRGCEEGGKGVE